MIREVFARAGAKPEGSSGNDFLDAILRERPDLEGQQAYFPTDGHSAHTVVIGDEVFKGPRKEMDEFLFDREHHILRHMEGKGLPVPRVTCVGKDAIFFGMTRLPGVPLSSVPLMAEEREALADDIANFIIGMMRAVPPRRNDTYAVHYDLHEANILVDPQTKRVTGIIDFGVIAYFPKGVRSGNTILGQKLEKLVEEKFQQKKKEQPDFFPPDARLPSRSPPAYA